MNHDSPANFYFNGEKISGWATQWHLCSLGDYFTTTSSTGWDEFIDVQHIWQLQCRIDHLGVVESEDANIFRVCSQEVLRILLLNQVHVIESIGSNIDDEEQGQAVFLQIVEGIAKMLELCARDGYAFWTSGEDEDNQRVLEWIKRSSLSPSCSNYTEPPHLKSRRAELTLRAQSQLSAIRTIAQGGSLDKRLRQVANQLPNITQN